MKPIDRRKFLQVTSAAAGLGMGVVGNIPGVMGEVLSGGKITTAAKVHKHLKSTATKATQYPHIKEQALTAQELWLQSISQGLNFVNNEIMLADHILVEDDAPGIGANNKDVWETIASGVILRKKLFVNIMPVRQAILTMMVYPLQPKPPMSGGKLKFHVNGHGPIVHEVRHQWTSIPIPREYIKKGENIIEVTVEDKTTKFRTPIASYSNYKYGSLDKSKPLYRSEQSIDGGKTWSNKGLGASNSINGEYPIRLKLRAYQQKGWLQTRTIDLADAAVEGVLRFPTVIESALLNLDAIQVKDADLVVMVRSGNTHQPEAGGWSDWKTINEEVIPSDLLERFIQVKFDITSSAGNSTPRIRGLKIFSQKKPLESGAREEIFVTEAVNRPLIPGSFKFLHEDPTHQALKELRATYELDTIVEGARTELEKVMLLRGWVASRWNWFMPDSEQALIRWDAREILNPQRNPGGSNKPGGFCLYYAIVFAQACQSFGIPARVVNINFAVYGGHEVAEIWSREYGKWIMIDPNFDSMFVTRDNGEPLNVLEMHRIFLDTYYPNGETVDRDSWTDEDRDRRAERIDPDNLPIRIQIGGQALSGSLKDYVWWKITDAPAPGYAGGYGFFNTAYLRWLPRSNWLSQPLPMPINHGRTHWGWDGYLAWADKQAPETPEHKNFVRHESDIYGRLFSVDFNAEPVESNILRITMATDSPGFAHFELIDNGKLITTPENIYLWELSPGINILELRSLDVFENKGTMSKLTVNYMPK
jgi:transglutaminase-like putative cysteine protease